MSQVVIVIHSAEEGGYWAEFPALPGCFTQGETIDELLSDAPLAVRSHLEALREFGQPIPDEHVYVTTIELSAPPAA